MLQILMIIFGVLALTRGELKISRNKVLRGDDCKMAGGILVAGGLVPIVVGGIAGLVILIAAFVGSMIYAWTRAGNIEPEKAKIEQ